MTMMHHDSRDYQTAKSDTAEHLRSKLENWKQGGNADAQTFLSRLQQETPRDYLASTRDLDFDYRAGRFYLQDTRRGKEWRLHRHAVGQMVTKTGILTAGVANKMVSAITTHKDEEGGERVEGWGKELLLNNLHTIFKKTDRKRVLLRAVDDGSGDLEVRGFLSDKYRRMSSGPIIETFAQTAINDFGAVPIRASSSKGRSFNSSFYHPTKVGFSMWLNEVFEPVDSEMILIGIMLQNSDFGASKLTISMQALRVWCTNLAVTKDELKKVHLGARLAEDIQFSEETYRLDTETMASATTDMVRNLFAPERVNGYMEAIKQAAEQKVDPNDLFARVRARGHLSKAEEEGVKGLYNEADIEMMPAGQTLWRASNAISLFANKVEDEGSPERAVELRQAAGAVLEDFSKGAAA